MGSVAVEGASYVNGTSSNRLNTGSDRLGPGQHTQYNLVPLAQLTQPIASVALGQDHTLALTASGEVLSWGLNRFSQLGYVLDVPVGTTARVEEPIQSVPRKIGTLKGKTVLGVAACKTASACWTASEVYTWGTNNGQLGRSRAVLASVRSLDNASQGMIRMHTRCKFCREW